MSQGHNSMEAIHATIRTEADMYLNLLVEVKQRMDAMEKNAERLAREQQNEVANLRQQIENLKKERDFFKAQYVRALKDHRTSMANLRDLHSNASTAMEAHVLAVMNAEAVSKPAYFEGWHFNVVQPSTSAQPAQRTTEISQNPQ